MRNRWSSTTIKANVSRMFETIEPWDVSNSIANLGEDAGKITWNNAQMIAADHAEWLKSDQREAVEGMQAWAESTGAWDNEEIAAWDDIDCLALFVQNIASELREHLESDENDLETSVKIYASTDWETKAGYPAGSYYMHGEYAYVDYYTGG